MTTAKPLTPWETGGIAFLPNAACRGTIPPDAFFPSSGRAGMRAPLVKEALKVCHGCDDRQACLIWALEHDERGIWGGLTERERRRLKRGAAA